MPASEGVVRPSAGHWYRLRSGSAAYCKSVEDGKARLVCKRNNFLDSTIVVVDCEGWFDRGRGLCSSDVVHKIAHPTLGINSFDANPSAMAVAAVLAANHFHISAALVLIVGKYGWIPIRGEFPVSTDWVIDNMPSPHGWATWADAVNSLATYLRNPNNRITPAFP